MERAVKEQETVSPSEEKKVIKNRSTDVRYENFKANVINNVILNKHNKY